MPVSRIIKFQGWACSACGWEHLHRLIIEEHEAECPSFFEEIRGVDQ